jgi:hypothetical protein
MDIEQAEPVLSAPRFGTDIDMLKCVLLGEHNGRANEPFKEPGHADIGPPIRWQGAPKI